MQEYALCADTRAVVLYHAILSDMAQQVKILSHKQLLSY